MEYGRQIFKFENGWAYINVSKVHAKAKVHQSSFDFQPLEFDFTNEQELEAFETICKQTKQFRSGELAHLLTEIDVDISGLTKDENEQWATVFAELSKIDDSYFDRSQPTSERTSSEADGHTRIPQTRLRRFYQTLRFFRTKDLATAIAKFLSGDTEARADEFTEIVDESILHFEGFRNLEGFRPERKTHAIDKYTEKDRPYAKCLQARIKNGQSISFVNQSNVGLAYVDYEISPLRKQGGQMDDGQVGTSGAGGLDLLLVDNSDPEAPVLVIGEVKATTDTDLFLAFVQALMYAVEFGSENQIARIRNQADYPTILQKLDVNTGVDIYLIYESKLEWHDSDDGLLYHETMKFCKNLMTKERTGSRLQKLIRKIKFVEAKLLEGEGVEFNVVGKVCREHDPLTDS